MSAAVTIFNLNHKNCSLFSEIQNKSLSSFSLCYQKTAAVKLHSSQMRGNLVGRTFSTVSKQAFMRKVPEKDGEKLVGKVVILTGKGSNSRVHFKIKTLYCSLPRCLNTH